MRSIDIKGNLVSFIILAVYVFINIFFIVFSSKIGTFFTINSALILFVFLIVVNVLLAFFLKLIRQLKEHWSIFKIYQFFIGFFVWLFILGIGYGLKLYFGGFNLITENKKATCFTGLGITFIIVAWEELMFRGIILNFLQRSCSILYLSFISGFLFMLIHFLNPEINLFVQGPNLFFAGFLLTNLYLKFKNIWLPLGFHFINNIFNSRMEIITGYHLNSNEIFFSNEGYLDTILLALTCFIFYRLKFNSRLATES